MVNQGERVEIQCCYEVGPEVISPLLPPSMRDDYNKALMTAPMKYRREER